MAYNQGETMPGLIVEQERGAMLLNSNSKNLIATIRKRKRFLLCCYASRMEGQ